MRFCIINDKDNIIIKKERSNNMFDQKSLNKINKINELKKDLNNENFSNKRRNVIKLSNSSSNIKNEKSEDASKSNDNNILKYSHTRIKDKNSFDFIDNNINRSFIKDNNISSNFSKDTHSYLDIINLKRTNSNFFPENLNKYEHNYSAPIELINFHEKNFNLHRSPILYPNKRKNIFNINNKNDEKNKVNESPRRNLYKPFVNTNFNRNNEEKNKIGNKIINKNIQSKGRIIK